MHTVPGLNKPTAEAAFAILLTNLAGTSPAQYASQSRRRTWHSLSSSAVTDCTKSRPPWPMVAAASKLEAATHALASTGSRAGVPYLNPPSLNCLRTISRRNTRLTNKTLLEFADVFAETPMPLPTRTVQHDIRLTVYRPFKLPPYRFLWKSARLPKSKCGKCSLRMW